MKYVDGKSFQLELTKLLNKHSKENPSDTPDHILARYLIMCLNSFDFAVKNRTIWYGEDK